MDDSLGIHSFFAEKDGELTQFVTLRFVTPGYKAQYSFELNGRPDLEGWWKQFEQSGVPPSIRMTPPGVFLFVYSVVQDVSAGTYRLYCGSVAVLRARKSPD